MLNDRAVRLQTFGDPNRRTGRTTRMLVTTLHRLLTDPSVKEAVVLCHTGRWASELKHMLSKMLIVLNVQFETKTTNAAQHEVKVDDRTIYFVSKPYEERFFQGRKISRAYVSYDNSYYIE